MSDVMYRFLRSKSGTTAVEYGVIAMLISVSFIAGALLIGNEVGNMFNDVGSDVAGAVK